MKKQLLLLTIMVGAFSLSASAQTSVPQFPPNSENGNSQNQTETNNPSPQQPRKKRYILPAIRVAFGVMDVVCAETGRCLENDFRRSQPQNTVVLPLQQPQNSRSMTNPNQGIVQNLVRRVTTRRP